MTRKPRITLNAPDPEGCDEDRYCMPVPIELVSYTIDLLQCFVAQYRRDVGIDCEPEVQVWAGLASAAGHALAGLLSAEATYDHDHGAAALVQEIAAYCLSPHVPQELEQVRTAGAVDVVPVGPQVPEITGALLALWEQGRRHEQEWRQRRDAAPQALTELSTAQDRDPGWEF
jgi:hypothetical protein